MKHITSIHNTTVRKIEQLQRKSKARKLEQQFIIEGRREIEMAVSGGYEILELVLSPEIFENQFGSTSNIKKKLKLNEEVVLTTIDPVVYDKVAYRGGTEGCLAFAKAKNQKLDHLILPENPLILIAESIEKPGNLGALLRTADAANVDLVIIADPRTDLYNPNVIRSSVGCLFTTTCVAATTLDTIEFLDRKNVNLYTATLQNSQRYDLINYQTPTAIAVGTEATGLSETMRDAATSSIIIPMSGSIDSMNVSVSASIILFEAKRQRNFK